MMPLFLALAITVITDNVRGVVLEKDLNEAERPTDPAVIAGLLEKLDAPDTDNFDVLLKLRFAGSDPFKPDREIRNALIRMIERRVSRAEELHLSDVAFAMRLIAERGAKPGVVYLASWTTPEKLSRVRCRDRQSTPEMTRQLLRDDAINALGWSRETYAAEVLTRVSRELADEGPQSRWLLNGARSSLENHAKVAAGLHEREFAGGTRRLQSLRELLKK